jgi:hypothetical protein
MNNDPDVKFRDRTGRIDPFKFALKSSRAATPEQMESAGLGPSQSSAAENDCEQDEGA